MKITVLEAGKPVPEVRVGLFVAAVNALTDENGQVEVPESVEVCEGMQSILRVRSTGYHSYEEAGYVFFTDPVSLQLDPVFEVYERSYPKPGVLERIGLALIRSGRRR